MLNFGPWLVPLAFAVFGLVVSAVRGIMQQLETSDSRLLLLPLLINLCFVILVSDSDNTLFFIIKNGFLPFAIIFAASSKIQRRNTAGDKIFLNAWFLMKMNIFAPSSLPIVFVNLV
jgi:hypothetical protein